MFPRILGVSLLSQMAVYNAFNYNMTAMVLAGNKINFVIAAGLTRLHMPGGK